MSSCAQQWDVREFLNKPVVLQIVDQTTGTWGHVSVDHIIQTDWKLVGVTITGEDARDQGSRKII